MTTADELKRARQLAGLSQMQAAVRSGVSVKTIRAWEQGAREPAYRAALEYMEALRM